MEQNRELEDLKKWMIAREPNLISDWKKEPNSFENLVLKEMARQRFEKIFTGTWLNQYEMPNKAIGQETFRLSSEKGQLAFITRDNAILLISKIQFTNDNTLTFTKTNKTLPDNPIINILRINNSSSLTGTENGNIKIHYSKVGD